MIRVRIETNDTATPVLAALARRAEDRAKLLDVVATEEKKLFVNYLSRQARVRHTSAQRLGATPTGQLEKVAGGVTAAPTADGVTVRLDEPYLFARAFRDVEIVPTGGKKMLTIPVAAESYGKRARQFSLRFYKPGPLAKHLVGARERQGGPAETLFILVPRVRQKQDRTLLPSDEEILAEAEAAAEKYLLAKADKGGSA